MARSDPGERLASLETEIRHLWRQSEATAAALREHGQLTSTAMTNLAGEFADLKSKVVAFKSLIRRYVQLAAVLAASTLVNMSGPHVARAAAEALRELLPVLLKLH